MRLRGRSAVRGDGNVGVLLGVSRVIDAINFRIGKVLAWLILAAVIVSAVNAVIRKLFDMSSNSWLELQWVLFGAVFLIVASWTLLDNEHIRIDIVNSMFTQRTRNIIDVIGHAFFLLPLTIIMIITSYPFVIKSVLLNEQSMNAGGLPQWPAKMLILIGFTLLFFRLAGVLLLVWCLGGCCFGGLGWVVGGGVAVGGGWFVWVFCRLWYY